MIRLALLLATVFAHKEVNFKAVVIGSKGFLSGFQQGVYDDDLLVLD